MSKQDHGQDARPAASRESQPAKRKRYATPTLVKRERLSQITAEDSKAASGVTVT